VSFMRRSSASSTARPPRASMIPVIPHMMVLAF
jgi:hypothetical protein